MKLPDAKPETWADLEAFTDWALGAGWDDERALNICTLFLKLRNLFEERDKDRIEH